ncbi:MAG TPA: hypothetical protein HPP80_04075 [Rhodospirillaceae bacterium]|nr:hypothetical protein [Rhodospirillaceae bacterium]
MVETRTLMKLDYLFKRHDPGTSWRNRKEPQLSSPSRAVVPAAEPEEMALDASEESLAPLKVMTSIQVEPRRMSPRQLAEWAHEMYIGGALSWQDYRIAGFPAELHPDYNDTVAVLTGRRAQPDWPRDMVQEWEDRLAFARRHNEPGGSEVRRAEKVLSLLRRQESRGLS